MHRLVSTLKFTVAINTKKLLCHVIENQFIDDFSDNFERNRYCKTFQSTGKRFSNSQVRDIRPFYIVYFETELNSLCRLHK